MNSVAGSTDAEDWLDISDSLSLPSLSLDDVLNEVSHLDDEPFDGGLSEGAGISPSPVPIPANYKLDNAVKVKRLESISHQLVSFRAKNGSAVAVAHSGSHTAVATSKGSLLIFDSEGRLERFWSGGDSDGSASCVTFSEGGKYVAVGYSKGFVKVINLRSGVMEELIKEAVQIGRGVLQVLYLDSGRTILTLDSGGSGLTTGGNVSPAMQCLAERACYQSVCVNRLHGSVIVLSHDELFEVSLLTEDDQMELFQSRGDYVSACLYLLDIYRGRLRAEKQFLDCLPRHLTEQLRKLVDVAMGGCKEGKVAELVAHYKAYISILLTVSIGTRSFTSLYEDIWPRVERDVISRSIFLESLDEFVLDGTLESPPPALVSEYLSHLASEGHFSQLQASVVRFPIHCIDIHYVMSTCKQNGLYDGIIYVMNKAFGDYLSPLEEMLCDVSSFASHEVLSDSEVERGNRLLLYLHCCLAGHAYPYGTLPPEQLTVVPDQVYRCITSLKGKDGTSATANYPYLRLLLLFDAQQDPRRNSRTIWVEWSLCVLAVRHGCNVGPRVLTCPVDEIRCLTRQFGSANCHKPLRDPVQKNGFNGRFEIFYVYPWNQLVEDIHILFIHVIGTCADAPIFQSENRLQRLIEIIGRLSTELREESALVHFLLLISQLAESSSILIPTELVEDVVTTLMRLDWHHSSAEFAIVETLRTAPQIDKKSVLRMALSPFRGFVPLSTVEKESSWISLKVMCGTVSTSELQTVVDKGRDRGAGTLVVCCTGAADLLGRDTEENRVAAPGLVYDRLEFTGIFALIRQILQGDLSQQEMHDISELVYGLIPQLVTVSPEQCALLVIDCLPDYLSGLRPQTPEERRACFPLLKAAFNIKRERQETFLQMDEDVDEHHFGIVFEGIVNEKLEDLDAVLQDLLLYWLPTGSRTDFCLNLAAEAECANSTILLMEARGLLDNAFEMLFKQINESNGDQQRFVYWLDKGLSFCTCHSGFSHSRGWLLRIMRAATGAVAEESSIDMEFRLRSLASGILENGSEHSLELVECLLDYPSFRHGLFSDYASLINKILGTCSHEKFVTKQLLLCIDQESAEDLHSMRGQLCRKIAGVIEDQCVICHTGVTKAAYLFSCGHLVHMECDNGDRRCPCVDDNVKKFTRNHYEVSASLLGSRYKRRSQETRDIFAKWNNVMLLTPH
ncbi:hypothetical protein Y032_0043g795 [Ancylostoma ceylanicum]|uniref:Vacuolar protein sorting-associated protein 8 central domain-containing protein n=1 Tax=Ancylostoma ceylanicum TaxID=53326 RepID=A0A016UEM3_9BILA|nr:hypothetical protein Y032_0043g795 [Ancylostoma ceylanicum]